MERDLGGSQGARWGKHFTKLFKVLDAKRWGGSLRNRVLVSGGCSPAGGSHAGRGTPQKKGGTCELCHEPWVRKREGIKAKRTTA